MGQFARQEIFRDLKQLLFTLAVVCVVLVGFRNDAFAKDSSKVPAGEIKIILESYCGDCSFSYTVSIFGDGRVVYESPQRFAQDKTRLLVSRGVPLFVGRQEGHVLPEQVAELVRKFEVANFYKLKEGYQGDCEDCGGSNLIITSKQVTKSISESHWGSVSSVHRVALDLKVLYSLEHEVIRLSGVQKWLHGDASLIPWLEAKNFDFNSDEAAHLIAAAAIERVPESIIFALLEKGISLDRSVVLEPSYGDKEDAIPAGQVVLESAISHGHTKVLKKLAAAGWLNKVAKERASEIFARSGGGCSPEFVDAAVAVGIDVKAVVAAKPGSGEDAAVGRNALGQITSSYFMCAKDLQRMAVRKKLLKKLLQLGLDPNHRDAKGETALFGINNIDQLKFLLAHGADAKLLDKNGLSAAFSYVGDVNTLLLLNAGASPAGLDNRCDSFEKITRDRKMPKSAKWLAEHPQALLGQVSLYASGKGRCEPMTSVY